MSLRPQRPVPPVPPATAPPARAAFPAGNPCLPLRDRLGAVFTDGDFADLYPERGQPACAPWRLALVTLLQFREGVRDRRGAPGGRGTGGPPRRSGAGSTGSTCSASNSATPASTTACSVSSAAVSSPPTPASGACSRACWT